MCFRYIKQNLIHSPTHLSWPCSIFVNNYFCPLTLDCMRFVVHYKHNRNQIQFERDSTNMLSYSFASSLPPSRHIREVLRIAVLRLLFKQFNLFIVQFQCYCWLESWKVLCFCYYYAARWVSRWLIQISSCFFSTSNYDFITRYPASEFKLLCVYLNNRK